MTNADWWARVVQARTERADLLPQRVWTLHKGEHAALRVWFAAFTQTQTRLAFLTGYKRLKREAAEEARG